MRIDLLIDRPASPHVPPIEAGHLIAYLKMHAWWAEVALDSPARQPGTLIVHAAQDPTLSPLAQIGIAPDGARALLEAARLFNDTCDPAPQDLAAIPGLRWRRDAELVVNPGNGSVEDVDTLPPADREAIGDTGSGTIHMQSHWHGRMFSPERLMEEVAEIRRRQNPKRIRVVDDQLVGDPSRWPEFVHLLLQRRLHQNVTFKAAARSERITVRVAGELAAANFRVLDFSVPDARAERLCLLARARRSEMETERLRTELDQLKGSRLVRLANRLRRK